MLAVREKESVREALPQRVERLLAKIRGRQLDLARKGEFAASARFARRARLVRELAVRMTKRC